MASPEAPVRFVGIDRESAAFRLMKQMGWEEGEGIGKDKQGIKGYIRVNNKQDTSGIGLEKKNAWAFDTTQFDNILKKLKVQSSDPKIDEVKKDDGNQVIAEASEAEQTQKPVKVTRPQGRYSKRERGKLVKNYSLKDLEGILVKKSEEPKVPEDEGELEAKTCDKLYMNAESYEEVQYPPEWWGYRNGFVSGGFLGAKSRKRKAVVDEAPSGKKKIGFLEEDQENLYNLVQDKATTGKQGLGIKDGPIKIAGCRYQGKKTSFNDSDDEDSTGTDCLEEEDEDEDEDEIPEAKSVEEPKLKLKKLCRQLLLQAPKGTLKLKELRAQIDQHSTTVFSSFSSKRDALSYLKQKLEGSSKFSIKGKRVSLTSQK